METKIDTKIALFNAENKRVGETFSRRARQLVKQQRAMWTDESHSAVRFLPDAIEEWEMGEEDAPATVDAAPATPESGRKNNLYALAARRLSVRRRMFWHTLTLFPGYLAFVLFADVMFWRPWDNFSGGFFIGTVFTLWTILYIHTVRQFAKYNRGFYPLTEMGTRQSRKLEEEVARLKRMGYDA
ncbi:MAG: hypothetical protein FWB88_02520 [Defluviitaleaceae bacterium]|nr:hypothetical protein [Defluviitaleaceae bacterium]